MNKEIIKLQVDTLTNVSETLRDRARTLMTEVEQLNNDADNVDSVIVVLNDMLLNNIADPEVNAMVAVFNQIQGLTSKFTDKSKNNNEMNNSEPSNTDNNKDDNNEEVDNTVSSDYDSFEPAESIKIEDSELDNLDEVFTTNKTDNNISSNTESTKPSESIKPDVPSNIESLEPTKPAPTSNPEPIKPAAPSNKSTSPDPEAIAARLAALGM